MYFRVTLDLYRYLASLQCNVRVSFLSVSSLSLSVRSVSILLVPSPSEALIMRYIEIRRVIRVRSTKGRR